MNKKFYFEFETEIFCNIINVFSVTFDQFQVSLQNKHIHLFCFKSKFLFSKLTIIKKNHLKNIYICKNIIQILPVMYIFY